MPTGTDVSSFKNAYKTAITADFPQTAELVLGNQRYCFEKTQLKLRYGTNPHQSFAAYLLLGGTPLFRNLEMLKGGKDGLSLTNLQDMSQALGILKFFPCKYADAVVAMKHLNPCGAKIGDAEKNEYLTELYIGARSCDERSHFGSVVGFNSGVDAETAEQIMGSFVECLIAPAYTEEALQILKRNEGTKKTNNSIRVAQYNKGDLERLPKFIGDNVEIPNIRNLADGTLTFETPYLTRIRTPADFVVDPMIPNADPTKNNGRDYVATTKPTQQQLDDGLTAWYININTRSNGIVFVKDGMALAVGTGQQERIGAVEQAIAKAKQKGHSLEGSVMSSDAFFPSRDCIDAIAKEGVKAVVWPAGSMNDAQIIEAANEHNIALLATLERCFAHF
jgi:phosphoribosylaminoimidazolecarboxamide formyltransferase/IMP cyclohydrolase